MIVFGGLAALCLIAGFGLGMYEYELRRQIVEAVHRVRPDLPRLMLLARARSLRDSEVVTLYREHFPDSPVLARRWMVTLAAPACFVLSAVFLVLAVRHP